MDKNDIVLINELIKLNVEKAVTKAVQPVLEHLKTNSKKDLKEIKLLLAKIITEGNGSTSAKKQNPTFLEHSRIKQKIKKQQTLDEDYEEDYETVEQYEEGDDENLLIIKSQTGLRGGVPDAMDLEAGLGDFDAPIFINKNSEAYQAMMESLEK